MTSTLDVFDVADPVVRNSLAPAAGLITPDVTLVPLPEPEGAFYATNVPLAPLHGLCPDVRFAAQPALAQFGKDPAHPFAEPAFSGSGFLIAPDLLVTAKHVLAQATDDRWRVVFPYQLEASGFPPVALTDTQVYTLKTLATGVADITIARLDRRVEGAVRIDLDCDFENNVGDSLTAIGFPLGLPKKVTLDGEIESIGSEFIVARLGAYKGSSGGPVFDANYRLVGFVSEGPPDHDHSFSRRGGCKCVLPCPGPNFPGIKLVRTRVICDLLSSLRKA